MDFNGKVVLITGASAGIGAGTAVYLASLGASLSLSGRNNERLNAVAEKCMNAGSPVEPFIVIGDLNEEKDVDNILKETIAHYGRLDVLVNNAGVVDLSNLQTISLENFDKVLKTNIRAIVQLTKLAMPYLIESKGNVINISSATSLRAGKTGLAYIMSKSALDQFTKCVALEVGPKHVRVNSVNPGGIVTDMLLGALSVDDQVNEAAADNMKKMHALGRFGDTKDIAMAIAFLASDMASNMTGVIFCVDGGFSITPPS